MSAVPKENEVCLEDQTKINKFARCNTRFNDLKEDISTIKSDIQNIADAQDDMMIALEPDENVPYQYGELFIMKTQDEAEQNFNEDKEEANKQLEILKAKSAELESSMTDLRTQLYAKFGNNIRLEESDDES